MIPILFPPDSTDWSTQGLGALADVISCDSLEEKNGQYEITMEYPITGIHYKEIKDRCIIYTIPSPYREPQPFRIYRSTKPLNGVCTFYARHITYDLSGIPLNPFTSLTAPEAMLDLQRNAAARSPFSFWTDKSTEARFSVPKPVSTRSVLGGHEGSILDVYGGEYEWDKLTVKLYQHRGRDNGVTIRYGKNLTDIEQDRNISQTYTGVYPYWADMDGENLVTCDPKIVPAPGTYDFINILTVDFSQDFEEKPTPEQLKEKAESYIKKNKVGVPKVSIKASFVQLEQTEEYRHLTLLEKCDLCDTVTIQFEQLGVDAKAQIIKIKTDTLRERYISVEIGEARSNISDTILDQQHTVDKVTDPSYIAQSVTEATKLITGGKGGNAVLRSSTGGNKPDEFLVMDMPDVAIAQMIWRWNMGGLGHSQSGYNGPYRLALTKDGAIVADAITVGILNANIIKAGIIADAAGRNSINMQTGETHLECDTLTIKGKTPEAIAQDKADTAKQEAIQEALNDLNAYKNTVTGSLNDLQGQIDGSIATWFASEIPTTTNYPANGWYTDDEKNKHLGDLYYVVDNSTYGGQVYRWAMVSWYYQWVRVEDTELAKALADAAKAQDTADGKRRVFVAEPTPPYDVGDLWAQGTNGDLMICKTARASGYYYYADWQKATDYVNSQTAGNIAQDKADAAKQEAIQEALSNLNAYKDTVTGSLTDLQGQIDGSISTWFAAEIPTTTNYPANGWNTDDEKNKHLGDLYYVVDNSTYGGQVYRWAMVSWYYQWVRVEDTELAKALADAAKAQDTADGKRRVFVTEPTPPYDVGDLWAQGTNGDLMVCKTARESGYYYYADWQKATDYVDSQAAGDIAQDKIDGLTQQQVFDKLTNNGAVQGIYMENGQLYINASYLATGILSAIRIQSKDAKSFWDLEQNLLKMHGEFSTDSGKYNMTMWAAMLTLMEGSNLRSRLRTEGDPYGNGRGYLQVFAGEATDNGLGANGKSTSVSPEAIEVGRVQSGALTGKVAVDTVQASRVTMSGQQVLSNEGGYRTGQFDKLALGSGLPYGVRWKWSPALGCYVLVSDQRPTFVTYTKTVDVTQAERPNWGDNYVDVTVPEGINLVQLSEFSPGVSYGTCETTVTIYRNGAEYFILKNTRCEYTGYGQNRQDILSYDAGDVKPGDVLRLRLRAQFNPDVSGAATSTASITYTFRGAESDEPVEEATAGNQNTAEIDPEGRNIKQERM